MPVENTILYYDTTTTDVYGVLLKTVTKIWNSINQMTAECETLPNGQTSGKFYQYATYSPTGWSSFPIGNATNFPTDVAEYDYGTVSALCVKPSSLPSRETVTTYKSFANTPLHTTFPSLLDRSAMVQVYGVVSGVRTLESETDYAYDGTSPTNVSPAPFGHDESNYGASSTAPRGNPTTVTKKCFVVGGSTCTDSVIHYTYDTTGQLLSSTDAKGNTTQYSYSDNYTTDDGSPTQNTNAYVTTITEPPTNGVSHVSHYQYGFNDGKLRKQTDENGQITKFCYWTGGCLGSSFDPFVRLTGINFPDTGVSTFTYTDGSSPAVRTLKAVTSTANLDTTTTYDALGRPTQTALSSDPEGPTYNVTQYDGMARAWKVYSPTRCSTPTINCGESTWGIVTNTYDALGRTTNVVQPDSSSFQNAYSSNQVTATDEVGSQRTTQSDALGRLTSVWEAPNATGYNYRTDYQYDALGNLIGVTQNGSNSANARMRSFQYDSLSRLITSQNPETGTISYSYDLNGNLAQKTSPKANQANPNTTTKINFCYDQLNRVTSKAYNTTACPPASFEATYTYDQGTNGVAAGQE